jgi:hypothetical protein
MRKDLFILIIVVIIAVFIMTYLISNVEDQTPINYEECVEEIIEKNSEIIKGKIEFGPAKNEPKGATRIDKEGNVWTKQGEAEWIIEEKDLYGEWPDGDGIPTGNLGLSRGSWGDVLIDEQPGGIDYISESLEKLDFSSCDKYLLISNANMKEELNEIMKEVIQEQSVKNIIISVESIEVVGAGSQGFIVLGCEKLDLETDRSIIKSIADRLFSKYPDKLAEGSGRKSSIDVVGCSESGSIPDGVNIFYHPTQWVISDGNYDYRV